MGPLKLTDDQLSAVMRAAAPLAQNVRKDFLQALAARLCGLRELGDGVVYRTIKEVQAEFWEPPHFEHGPQPRKWETSSNAAKWEAARNRERGGGSGAD
jgi:hypothetical protein